MHLKHKLKAIINSTIFQTIEPIRYSLVKAINKSGTYFCAICESNIRKFAPFGDPPRENAKCPVCGALERHRLDWIFFTSQTDLFDKSRKKMLHIAPEEFLSKRFKRCQNLEYLSADKYNPNAMVQMDITHINYPDNSFHVIYCNHVLEHIENDKKAISEIYRVLCNGGWAVLQVPITAEKTLEDPTIIDPDERKKHFGQSDHVRRCGPDYVERMRSAGFISQVFRSTDLVSEDDCERMGFQTNRLIFFCRKPSPKKAHAAGA